jgi:hypothetical protein
MLTIRHMERRILDRLEDMGERLEEFESKLNHNGNGHEKKPRRSRRAASRTEPSSPTE